MGVNKASLFYVDKRNRDRAHCFVLREPKCFYWLLVHLHFNTFGVLCTVTANEQKKYRTKTKNCEFHVLNQSCFINNGLIKP